VLYFLCQSVCLSSTWWTGSQESVRIVSLDWREIGKLFGKFRWVYLSFCIHFLSVCLFVYLLLFLCQSVFLLDEEEVKSHSELFHLIGLKLENYLGSSDIVFVYLYSLFLSVCLFVCLLFFLCQSVCLSFYLMKKKSRVILNCSNWLALNWRTIWAVWVSLSVCLPFYLFICILSFSLCVCLSVCYSFFANLSACLSTWWRRSQESFWTFPLD